MPLWAGRIQPQWARVLQVAQARVRRSDGVSYLGALFSAIRVAAGKAMQDKSGILYTPASMNSEPQNAGSSGAYGGVHGFGERGIGA